MPRLVQLAWAATLLVGCVTTAEQGRRMQADIEALAGRHDALRTDLAAEQKRTRASEAELRAALEVLGKRLSAIEATLEDLGLTSRRTDADFTVAVDRLVSEIQLLRGGLEELRYKVDRRLEAAKAFEEDTGRRLAVLKSDEALEAYETRVAAEKVDDPKKFAELVKTRFAAKSYGLARELAEQFLRRWPSDPAAPDVLHALAKSYYDEEKWRPAILELNKFRERYPDDKRLPDVLVMIGDCFAAIDLRPEAGRFFDAVIARYAGTNAAKTAARRKKELDIK